MRWQIEESHKLLAADYFGQGHFHAKTAEGVRQEDFAQALFVAITRTLMAAAFVAAMGIRSVTQRRPCLRLTA